MDKASNIKIKQNYVLIKPEKDIEQLKSGLYIQAGQENKKRGLANTEARHYNITGTVLVVPDKLIYRGEQLKKIRKRTRGIYNDYDVKELQAAVNGSLEYQTEIEIQAGDKVWFDYIAHINANTEMKTVQVEGHGECIFVNYSQLFIRERENEKIPINGWIFIRKISTDRTLTSGLILPMSANVLVKNQAEVVIIGKGHDDYLSVKHTDFWFKEVKPGDKIIYNEALATPLEYEIHETEGLEKLFKIKRKDIQAIFSDSELLFDSNPDTNIRVPY